MKKFAAFFVALLFLSTTLFAQTKSEFATTRYLDKIKNDPQQLLVFLQDMPKGADLHNHHGGATMAENMIHYAENDHMCLDRKTLTVSANPACASENYLENSLQDSTLYNAIIDAWSMRFFVPGKESGHDHFFATFFKFYPIVNAHSGEILAEVVNRAGQQNEIYQELLMTSENMAVSTLAKQVGYDSDFSALRNKLLNQGLDKLINKISSNFSADEAKANKILACSTQDAKPGCKVKVRYIYLTLREMSPVEVFAQLLTGFELAKKDPRVVGINMVQAEDGVISMRDYNLHMKMVSFLHKLYPDVRITLHAGELASGLVPPEDLGFHIREAVETAHADRIGHGVDIAYENNSQQLLQEMANKHIMVEINLSSNEQILGVKGTNHPLPLYLRYHVPVALSTDDEGVLRTNITEQYQKAILTYQLSYPTVKELVRNSISYSFLPGKSLWQDYNYRQVVAACAKDTIGNATPSKACQIFLNNNEKASMQWELEKRFNQFEIKFG